jgi:2-C-methyl-D-erythritol 4-phosphate cytidylyltransferase/2-C-methyl-D-erythritol 2,4-cyclodiphosphate synthase
MRCGVGPTAWCVGTQDRAGLYRAQTPQGFALDAIIAAHEAFDTTDGDPADDVEVARAAGLDVAIVEGFEDNMKITTPGDFARADRLLRGKMDIRIGTGFDVHRFGAGDAVVLCGVAVPHARGLQGHSDADVGMHALTDAIYGAMAEGDIGRHFPPSDPQWKGAASDIFLRHAVELAGEKGFRINNMDITLICERPKITPHAPAMMARLAEITGVEATRISVKATTSERLGFTGREEGIAAQAAVTLVPAKGSMMTQPPDRHGMLRGPPEALRPAPGGPPWRCLSHGRCMPSAGPPAVRGIVGGLREGLVGHGTGNRRSG